MDDNEKIEVTKQQARLLLAGVAVASGALALTEELLTPADFLALLQVFIARLGTDDREWLLELAKKVEPTPEPPPEPPLPPMPFTPTTWH